MESRYRFDPLGILLANVVRFRDNATRIEDAEKQSSYHATCGDKSYAVRLRNIDLDNRSLLVGKTIITLIPSSCYFHLHRAILTLWSSLSFQGEAIVEFQQTRLIECARQAASRAVEST